MKLRGFALVGVLFAAGAASAQEAAPERSEVPRPDAGVVEVLVQGPTGAAAPESGAPPPLEVSTEPKPARGLIDPPKRPRPAALDVEPSLRALSFSGDEATVDVRGQNQVLRPGSRLGDDVVKSVSPGRLVLVRPEIVDGETREAIVLVTFDAAGEATTRVFRTHDPTASAAPEVKTP